MYVPSGMASEFAWNDRDQNRHTLSPDNVFVSTDVNKTQAILDFSIVWGRNSAYTRYAITPCPITAWVQSQPGNVGWFEISMTDIVDAAERVRQYFIANPPTYGQGPEYKPYESLAQGQSWGVVINLQTINGIYTMD